MARIISVDIFMVDLQPMVRRTDAIQSFDSQQTPFVQITDSDGVTGLGYSYTIGQGGSAVMALLRDDLIGQLIGRDVDQRMPASIALAVLAAERGAAIIRTHDVAETRDALAMYSALSELESQ